jgi:hypothetical protein
MMKARDNGTTMILKECAEAWNKLPKSTHDKYEEYAEEVKEERTKNRDLYEIAFNIKPKRPLSAYNFFLMDIAKQDKFSGLKEGHEMWEKLSDEEKEKYLKIAKKAQLAYLVKKAEYNNHMRKQMSKPKSAFNLFVSDMKGKIPESDQLGEGGVFAYCYNKWKKLDEAAKKKYEKLAMESAEEHRDNLESKVFELPKKPINGYNKYLQDRLPVLKDKHPEKATNELFAVIGQEWRNSKQSVKDKYTSNYESELVEYKEKMKEYNRQGFYTPNKSDISTSKSASKSVSKSVGKSKNKMESSKKGKGK